MADIVQAAKWLQEGKQIRRPDWHGRLRCYARNHRILYSDGEYYEMYMPDLLADDWEIAK
jgi:hypothetical protein